MHEESAILKELRGLHDTCRSTLAAVNREPHKTPRPSGVLTPKEAAALLTIEDAAAMLRVSPITVKHYIRLRKLPVIHLTPRTPRFRHSDLEAFLAQRVRPVFDPSMVGRTRRRS